MPVIDLMNDDPFSLASLTMAINDMPVAPNQIHQAGVFEEIPVNTTQILIERESGSSALIPYSQRGGPGDTIGKGKRNMRSFVVEHVQRDDALLADEVQNVREFGTTDGRASLPRAVDKRIARHLVDLDMTIEHQRFGAIKGIVLDKEGAVIENLYTAFEVAQPTPISFELDVDSTNLKTLADQVGYQVEDAIEGQFFEELWCPCGRDFWDKLIAHPYALASYGEAQKEMARLGKTVKRFSVGPLVFERYKLSPSSKAAASLAPFIEADKARVVPMGVPDMFVTYFAPADYNETVNTLGLPRYMRAIEKQNKKGYDLEIQSNPLSICTRPGALFELTLT